VKGNSIVETKIYKDDSEEIILLSDGSDKYRAISLNYDIEVKASISEDNTVKIENVKYYNISGESDTVLSQIAHILKETGMIKV
jgi:hypothetical protein